MATDCIVARQTVTELTSSTHTVSGKIVQDGKIVVVYGYFIAQSATSDNVTLNNIPTSHLQFGFVARNHNTGSLCTMWGGGSRVISTYGHSGTIAVGDQIDFSFTYAIS